MRDCGNGIYCIDTHYEGDENNAVFLLRSNGRAAVIETSNNASLRYTLAAVGSLGIAKDEVDLVCVTHVHLDHAGGAGSYMREFPNARLVLHPRGARHMADPARLMESVRSVYGMAKAERLYGTLLPVPRERIVTPSDGEKLSFGGMTLLCLNTPGHAEHHMAFFEESTGALFAGDAFGISYPWMKDTYGRRWVFPSSSPVQFAPGSMASSIDRLMSLPPSRVFLTHFGEIGDIAGNAALLKEMIKKYVGIALAAEGDEKEIQSGLSRLYEETAKARGTVFPAGTPEASAPLDVEINAQGLAFWYKNAYLRDKGDTAKGK